MVGHKWAGGRRLNLSRKNNINTDHYKTVGRGRQSDEVIHEIHRHALTKTKSGIRVQGATTLIGDPLGRSRHVGRSERIRRAQRFRRLRKVRGLSARQLMERKMSLRAMEHTSLQMRKEE
jgi:hypothetical protein